MTVNIMYGVGMPEYIPQGCTHYCDLERDAMYQITNGELILKSLNGTPVNPDGTPVEW